MGIFNAVLCRFIFLYREIKRIVILLAGNDRRKGKGDFMVENREEKSNKKETSGKGRKEPVKIVVKPVYVGKQEMTEVFGSVALDNIRRKMQGS